MYEFHALRGVYTSNFFYDLELHLGQKVSLYVVNSLRQSLRQIFCSIKGQFLAPIKTQIVKQIGCVDVALSGVYTSNLLNDLDFYLGPNIVPL